MQFHLGGFRPGDPRRQPAQARDSADPNTVDVLIVGCGPAGLTLAAYLAQFPQIRTKIVERKAGPLELGQADGVSCRSMEMFQAFGFAETVKEEAYWVNETVFWTPNAAGTLHRAGRVQDVEDGLSEMPHVILNQARVHDIYLRVMENAPTRLTPDYNTEVAGLTIDRSADPPVTVTLNTGQTLRARYVVGCDGARSTVRAAIGQALQGDSANQVWGVMDVLVVTDFPDIRFKAVVQSADAGTALIIPREGGYLVRLYVEQGKLAPGERVADRQITPEQLIAQAQRILAPHSFEVKEIVWWSAYQIGQRLCARFDDDAEDPRIFIAGDACHTHSPKAGQGMNVSMGDGFDLGWKLAAVLQGRAQPHLLRSYTAERQAVAQDLIDFDRHWAQAIRDTGPDDDALPPVQRQFIRQGRMTAGVSVRYTDPLLTGPDTWQGLAAGFEIGTRFHSAPVLRLADAKPMELGHVIQADGRWRLFAFAPFEALAGLCDALHPVIHRFTPDGVNIDATIDLRAILPSTDRETEITALPDLLFPAKGPYPLRDYEKVFTATDPDIFALRGIDPGGAMALVRPDQYVAHVLPLQAIASLETHLAGFLQTLNSRANA